MEFILTYRDNREGIVPTMGPNSLQASIGIDVEHKNNSYELECSMYVHK